MGVVANSEILKLLCDLLQDQLEIGPDRVLPYNEKWNVEKDYGIYVCLGLMNAMPFGASTRTQWNVSTSKMEEYQILHEKHMYSLNVFSRDRSAAIRCHEIVFALNSVQSQQIQELHGFRIAHLPVSFVDATQIEGAARLHRYALTFNVIRSYERTKDISHYDNFSIPPELLTNQ